MYRWALAAIAGLVVLAGLAGGAGRAEAAAPDPFDGSLAAPVFPGARVIDLGQLPGPYGRPLRARLFVTDAALEAVLAHYVDALGAPGRTVVGHVVREGLAYVAWADDPDGRLRVLTVVRSDGSTYVFPSDVDPEAVLADAAGPGTRAGPGEGAALSLGDGAGPGTRSFVVPEDVDRAAARIRERFEREGFVARAVHSAPGRALLLLEKDSGAAATVVVTAVEEGSRVTVQRTGGGVDLGAGDGAGSGT
jgi:hypothetical protein